MVSRVIAIHRSDGTITDEISNQFSYNKEKEIWRRNLLEESFEKLKRSQEDLFLVDQLNKIISTDFYHQYQREHLMRLLNSAEYQYTSGSLSKEDEEVEERIIAEKFDFIRNQKAEREASSKRQSSIIEAINRNRESLSILSTRNDDSEIFLRSQRMLEGIRNLPYEEIIKIEQHLTAAKIPLLPSKPTEQVCNLYEEIRELLLRKVDLQLQIELIENAF